jgi:hypothetical protein
MNILKGWLGEKKAAFRMWLFLSKRTYKRFHNIIIIIPGQNGTTQIDHLVVRRLTFLSLRPRIKKDGYLGRRTGQNGHKAYTVAILLYRIY